MDGTYASTRLKSTVTEGWANERFRQVMLLVREFWVEWPARSLLTNDDVATIRSLVDCAASWPVDYYVAASQQAAKRFQIVSGFRSTC